jgi:octaprenyl-diphosphate synthase
LLQLMQRPAQTNPSDGVPWAEISAFQLIDTELRRVADLIRRSLAEPGAAGDLTPLYDYLGARRGKMIRPGLVLLAGRSVGRITETHLRVAAMVEMIHTATLLHDDVIDHGRTRRGAPTVNRLWGNESAVLLGDYVLSRVFKMAADLDPPVAQVLAQTAVRVCEGELRQALRRRDWQLREIEYIEIIADKTAAFFSGCCRLGGLLSCDRQDEIDALAEYGLCAGIAFQITDDILDITGEESRMGKDAQSDLEKSKLTLAGIHLLEHVDASQRDRIYEMLRSRRRHRQELGGLLLRYGSLQYARQRARDYVAQATRALQGVPEGSARDTLVETARFMADRAA